MDSISRNQFINSISFIPIRPLKFKMIFSSTKRRCQWLVVQTIVDKIMPNTSMTHGACKSKLCSVVRSFIHPYLGNQAAIVRTPHTFNAGIRCRHRYTPNYLYLGTLSFTEICCQVDLFEIYRINQLNFSSVYIICVNAEKERHLPGFYEDFDNYIASLQSKGLWELVLQETKDNYYTEAGKTYVGLINVWSVTKC